MVNEALYAVLGVSSCYTAFHLVQAFRKGEFGPNDYGRPPVFLPERRSVRRSCHVDTVDSTEPVDSRR